MRGLWALCSRGSKGARSKHGRRPIEGCPSRNRRNGARFFWSEKDGKERPQKKGKGRKQRGLLVEQKQGHRGDERERVRKQKSDGKEERAGQRERHPPVRVVDGVPGLFEGKNSLITSVLGGGTGSWMDYEVPKGK